MNYIIGILLSIVGIGMLGFWLIHITKGGLPQGIRTLENGGHIAFHISIELLTGIVCLVSGTTICLETAWAVPVGLLSCGMLLYTSINSLAWKEVREKPVISLMFVVPAIIAVLSIVYLFTVC